MGWERAGETLTEGASSEMQSDFPEAAQPSDGKAPFKSPHSPTSLAFSFLETALGWVLQAPSDQQSPSAVTLGTAGLEHSPQASGPGVSASSNQQQCQSTFRICLGHAVCCGCMQLPPPLLPSLCSEILCLPKVAPRPSQGADTVPGPVPGVGHCSLPSSSASPLAETAPCAPC